MKKIIIHLLPIFAFLMSNTGSAQQNSLFNTYSLDPLQLNIAYAGAACTEANVHYRTQWIGLKETPKLIQLNAHTALGKSNALALRVNSQTQGILNTLQASLGYAYRFRVSEKAKIHLGLGIGWSQAALNAQKAVVIDANDVTLNNNNRQTANGFDSEFGAMLVGEKLKAGVSVLHLYNSSPNFSGTNTYKVLPQVNTQVSYTFNKGKKVEIEPWLLDRYTVNGTHVAEGMLNVNFIQMITVGAGYRSGYGVMGLLGAKVGNIKLAYSFDYGTTQNATNMGSSHQVMLGFSLCKTAKTPKPAEEPVATTPTVQPIVEPVKEEPVAVAEPVKEEPKQPEATKEEIKKDIIHEMPAIAAELAGHREVSHFKRRGGLRRSRMFGELTLQALPGHGKDELLLVEVGAVDFAGNAPVTQDRDAVANRHHLRQTVRYVDHRHALRLQPAQHTEEAFDLRARQRCRRLVEHQHTRP